MTFKLPLFPEVEILVEAKVVKLFAYCVSVKDTPLAVDVEVLNDFEGQYLSSSFFHYLIYNHYVYFRFLFSE